MTEENEELSFEEFAAKKAEEKKVEEKAADQPAAAVLKPDRRVSNWMIVAAVLLVVARFGYVLARWPALISEPGSLWTVAATFPGGDATARAVEYATIVRSGENVRRLYRDGMAAYDAAVYGRAVQEFLDGLKLAPGNYVLAFRIGMAQYHQAMQRYQADAGRVQLLYGMGSAIQYYTRAIEMNPSCWECYYWRAASLSFSEDPEVRHKLLVNFRMIIDDLTVFNRIAPSDTVLRGDYDARMALAWYVVGDMQASLDYIARALARNPGLSERYNLFFRAGCAYDRLGDKAKAEEVYAEAKKIAAEAGIPDTFAAAYNRRPRSCE